jgi:hypothetical protein
MGSRCGLGWELLELPSILAIVTELRQHQDDLLSAILKTRQASTSPNTKESPTVLPIDRCVHENLFWDLYVLNTRNMQRVVACSLCTKYKEHAKSSSTLYCKIRNSLMPSFVHVPSSSPNSQYADVNRTSLQELPSLGWDCTWSGIKEEDPTLGGQGLCPFTAQSSTFSCSKLLTKFVASGKLTKSLTSFQNSITGCSLHWKSRILQERLHRCRT